MLRPFMGETPKQGMGTDLKIYIVDFSLVFLYPLLFHIPHPQLASATTLIANSPSTTNMDSSDYPSSNPGGSAYGSRRTDHLQGPGPSDLSRRGLMNVPSSMSDPRLPPPSFGSSQNAYSNAAPHQRSNGGFLTSQYPSQQSHHGVPRQFQIRTGEPQTHYNPPSFKEEEEEVQHPGGGMVHVHANTEGDNDTDSETASEYTGDDTPLHSEYARSGSRSPSGDVGSSRQSGIEPKDDGTNAQSLGEAFAKYLASPDCVSKSDAVNKLNETLKGQGFSVRDRTEISDQSRQISMLKDDNKRLSGKNSTLSSNFGMAADGFRREKAKNSALEKNIDILNENMELEREIANNSSRLIGLRSNESATSFSPQFSAYKQGTQAMTDLETLLEGSRASFQDCSSMRSVLASLQAAQMRQSSGRFGAVY